MLSQNRISKFFTKIRGTHTRRISLSRKSVSVILTLILLAAFGGGLYLRGLSQPPQTIAADESELKTAIARQGDLILYASGSGTLIALSETSFGFNTSGQVTQLNIKVGDVVEAGQVLAELDNASATLTYQRAQRTLNEMTSPAAIAIAQDSVATAEYNVATTREDLQYLISPAVQIWQERLQEAEKTLAEAQAEASAHPSEEANQKVQTAQDTVTLAQAYLEDAEQNYDTYLKDNFSEMRTDPRTGNARIIYYRDDETGRRYTEIHAPTETEIAITQAAYDLAKATLEEAQTYLTAISGGEIPEGVKSASLTLLENAKTNVQAAQLELENTRLLAPISGMVMSMDFKVGDNVNGNTAVMTIANRDQAALQIFLDELDWDNVKAGYETEVVFDILPDSTFSGKVIRVDPALYAENNTSVVRAVVSLQSTEASFNLPIGSTASVEVIGGRAENAVLIPVEALHKAGEQYAVFVIENGGLKLRIVEVGIQNSLYAEIISGLEIGDVVSTGITETK